MSSNIYEVSEGEVFISLDDPRLDEICKKAFEYAKNKTKLLTSCKGNKKGGIIETNGGKLKPSDHVPITPEQVEEMIGNITIVRDVDSILTNLG